VGFLIFLVVIIFLFSFIAVIALLVKTSRLSEEMIYLNKKLNELLASKPSGQQKPEVQPQAPLVTVETAPLPSEPVVADEAAPPPPVPENLADLAIFKKPPAPEENKSPSWFEPIKKFIGGGNLWAAGGVILLIIAFGMLIAFLANRGFFTVEMGIAAAAVCGLFMIVFGWRFKKRRPMYFSLLQGGGVGILYLSVFAAHKLTTYFPVPLSLLLLTILIIPTVVLAMLQNSQALALLGFLGGFAAPLLLSSESGNHVFLFSYYSVLNAAILAINFRIIWKWLGATAFICTFVVLFYWVIKHYDKSMYFSAQPFVIGFILIFTTIGLLYLKDKEISYPNVSILAGTPIIGTVVQWNLISHFTHGLAINSIVFSVFYLTIVLLLQKKYGKENLSLIRRSAMEGYLALMIIFANIAIPLELSKEITSAAWAAEGLVFLLLGLRLGNIQFQIWGFIVHIAGAIAFAVKTSHIDYRISPFMSPQFIGSIVIALSAVSMALLLNQFKFKKVILIKILTVWALIWWFASWLNEAVRFTVFYYAGPAPSFGIEDPQGVFLLVSSLSAAAFYFIARSFRFSWLNIAVFPSIVSAVFFMLGTFMERIAIHSHEPIKILTFNFFHGFDTAAWLLFFAVHALLIYLFRKRTETHIPEKLHAAWLFTIILITLPVLTASARAFTEFLNLAESWRSFAGILPSLATLFGIAFFTNRTAEISENYKKLFFFVLPLLVSIVLGMWFLVTLFLPGNPSPLPLYIPFINPLDLHQGFCIAVITAWFIFNKNSAWFNKRLFVLIDIMALLWGTAITARCVHYYAGVQMHMMWDSSIYQLGIFIFWALYGIAHIIGGNRTGLRPVWIAGAVLVIIDIAKLLLLDLAGTGAISRIISFFIAGAVLLFIGWAAPLPPSAPKEQSEN
jgi:uncharacterized membrane protein